MEYGIRDLHFDLFPKFVQLREEREKGMRIVVMGTETETETRTRKGQTRTEDEAKANKKRRKKARTIKRERKGGRTKYENETG